MHGRRAFDHPRRRGLVGAGGGGGGVGGGGGWVGAGGFRLLKGFRGFRHGYVWRPQRLREASMTERVGRVVGDTPRRRIGFGTAGAAMIAALVLLIAGVFTAA